MTEPDEKLVAENAALRETLLWIENYCDVMASQSDCAVLRDVNFAFRESRDRARAALGRAGR